MPTEKKERVFPVDSRDSEKMMELFAKFILAPIRMGANQIIIHSDGAGKIVKLEEKRVVR